MKKNITFISIILLIAIILFAMFFSKQTYSVDNSSYTGTREDLQNMVLATAQSYYFKRNYSDYDQLAINPMYSSENGSFGRYTALMNWRDFNNSPEMVSRSNMYNIDCSSFASIVYLYSLGYDFSDYRTAKINDNYVMTSKFGSYNYNDNTWTNENHVYDSLENYQNAYLLQGIGQSSTLSAMIKSQVANYDGFNTNVKDTNSKNSEFIYYYETRLTDNTNNNLESLQNDLEITENELVSNSVGCNTTHYNESCSEQQQIKNDIINALRPGDIVLYRTKNVDTGKTYGHVIVYVGDIFNANEKGFIHSVGYDYDLKKDGSGSNGEDLYSVRYDTWNDRFEKEIFVSSASKESLLFAIIRPINSYCEKNNVGNEVCTIDDSTIKSKKYKDNKDFYLGNSVSRKNMFNIDAEEYQYKDKNNNDIITKYNSVNVGDIISYRLTVTDKSKFNYCTLGNYSSTENTCESNGGEWRTSNRGEAIDYANIKVTAEVPEGTSYNACTMVLYKGSKYAINTNCSFNNNTNVVTWQNVSDLDSDLLEECSLSGDCQYTFTLKVKASRSGKITNKGMHIINGDNDIQFGELTTLVNYTINNNQTQIFQDIVDDKINNNYTGNAMSFIKDVYSDALNVNLSNLSYDSIKNALFLDITTANDHNAGVYNIFVRKKDVSTSLKNIESMLVPGLYGGRRLKGNDFGDRARIVSKIGKKMTLEVGDILVTYDFYAGKNYAYLFYGYDSNNRPIFALYDENDGKIVKTPLSINGDLGSDTSKIGYRVFKSMYAYDLFAILRPTMTYEQSDSLDFEVTGSFLVDENNLIIKNIPIGMTIDSFLSKISTTDAKTITNAQDAQIVGRNNLVTGDLLTIKHGLIQKKYKLLVIGDVNSDGNMNMADARILARYIIDNKSTINSKNLLAGDINNDGIIKMTDVTKMVKMFS